MITSDTAHTLLRASLAAGQRSFRLSGVPRKAMRGLSKLLVLAARGEVYVEPRPKQYNRTPRKVRPRSLRNQRLGVTHLYV